ATLGPRAGGQALEVPFVHSLREAGEPAVVVGTAAEQPSLRTLPGPPAPSRSTVGLAEAREGGAPLLYVTADTPEGVLQAAWGLVAERERLAGAPAGFSGPPQLEGRGARGGGGVAPPRPRLRLSPLGAAPAGGPAWGA